MSVDLVRNQSQHWLWLPCDDDEVLDKKLRLFLIFGLMLYAGENITFSVASIRRSGIATPFSVFVIADLISIAGLIWSKHPKVALMPSMFTKILIIYYTWLELPNHSYLIIIAIVTYLILSGPEIWEQRLAARALRWLFVTVLVGSVVAKLAHGAWLGAEYFNLVVASGAAKFERWYQFFGLHEEISHFQIMGVMAGSGPFTSNVWLFPFLLKTVIVLELLLPVLLFFSRTRNHIAKELMLFLILIQIVAIEPFFGLLGVNFAFLFLPKGLASRPKSFYYYSILATTIAISIQMFRSV